MKKYCLLFVALFTASLLAHAQYETVTFNYERSYFNEGNPLPAETHFIIQGEIPEGVNVVQAVIYRNGSDDVLHKAVWKRGPGNQSRVFQIPVTYKLRGNSEYDVRLNYFQQMDTRSSRQFNRQLYDYLDAYVDQVVRVERNRIRLNEPVNRVMDNLNLIVERSTLYYDNKADISFPGFSDLVDRSLRNLRNQNLNQGQFALLRRRNDDDQAARTRYARQQIDQFKELVRSEVSAFLNTDLLTVSDTKFISSYATERLPTTVLLNAGYGGVYFSGDLNNLSYGQSFYAGVSFPLANKAFASRFLSRMSISTGVFFNNFQNAEGQTLSAPLVNRPVYVGLGYPIADFLRFNAGATVLQNTETAPNGLNFQQVIFRPFVGLSLDLNVWLGIGNRSREILRR